jgi:hypothetical protein
MTTKHRTIREKTRDCLLYGVIAVSLATLIVLYGYYQARSGHTTGLQVKWLGFAILTAFVFGNAIRYSKPFWGSRKFWAFLALFSVVHLGLGVPVLLRLTNIPLLYFALITPIEYFILTTCRDRFVVRPHSR